MRRRADQAPPRRAVIYARLSSELQRAASIADQIEICRRSLNARAGS